MKWQFNLTEGSKNINLNAEVIFTTYQIEEVKVTGHGISIVLMNNRPLLQAIELRQALSWRLISGEVKDQNLLAKIRKEVEKHVTKGTILENAVAAKLIAAKPPVANPAPAKPAVNQAAVAKPVVDQPAATKPAVAQPVATKPAANQPVGKSNKDAGKKMARA